MRDLINIVEGIKISRMMDNRSYWGAVQKVRFEQCEDMGEIGGFKAGNCVVRGESSIILFDDQGPFGYATLYEGEVPGRTGDGVNITNVFLSRHRGQNLGIEIYRWLLNNGFDFIVADTTQTMGGVKIWQRLVQQPDIQVFVQRGSNSPEAVNDVAGLQAAYVDGDEDDDFEDEYWNGMVPQSILDARANEKVVLFATMKGG